MDKTVEIKTCSKCDETKPLCEFPKKGATCKVCVAARMKEYQEKNREEIAARKKEYRAENREEKIRLKRLLNQY
jgi:hypothetical protein